MSEEAVAQALESFFEERRVDAVLLAYLLGSEGRGRPHAESDVDVAVLLDRGRLPTSGERFDHRVGLASELIARLHRNEVDVVVLNDLPPLFARRIVTEGRRVFRLTAAAEHEFVRDVQLRAADLAPFVARGRRRLLDRLVS